MSDKKKKTEEKKKNIMIKKRRKNYSNNNNDININRDEKTNISEGSAISPESNPSANSKCNHMYCGREATQLIATFPSICPLRLLPADAVD